MKKISVVILLVLTFSVINSCTYTNIMADKKIKEYKISNENILILGETTRLVKNFTEELCDELIKQLKKKNINAKYLLYDEDDLSSDEKIDKIRSSFKPDIDLSLQYKTINGPNRRGVAEDVLIAVKLIKDNDTIWFASINTNKISKPAWPNMAESVAVDLLKKMQEDNILAGDNK